MKVKVKEVIKFEGWIDGSGRSWVDTYAEDVVEIEESWLPKNANEYDWSWYETPEENPEDYGRDTKIIVEFYAEDAEPGWDEPIVRFSKWESDLWKERNA